VWSPFSPDQVPAPVLQRRYQARPHLGGVMALYPIRTADRVFKVRCKELQTGYPAANLSKNKKSASQGPKDFVVGEWRQNGSVWLRGGCLAY